MTLPYIPLIPRSPPQIFFKHTHPQILPMATPHPRRHRLPKYCTSDTVNVRLTHRGVPRHRSRTRADTTTRLSLPIHPRHNAHTLPPPFLRLPFAPGLAEKRVAGRHLTCLHMGCLSIPLSRNTENRENKTGLTVFLLFDPGLELDVLDDREQRMRHEYGCNAQSRDEDGEYVGLHADHLGAYHSISKTSYFFFGSQLSTFFSVYHFLTQVAKMVQGCRR